MKLFLKLVLGVLLVIGIGGTVNATPLYYDFDVEVTDLVSGFNDLGLDVGSLISVSLKLDSSVTGSGADPYFDTHEPEDYTSPLTVDDFGLEVTISGTVYDEEDDLGYTDYPNITVNLPSWDFHRLELMTGDFYLYLDENFGIRLASVFRNDTGNTLPAQYRDDDGNWITLDESDLAWAVDGRLSGSTAPVPEPNTFTLLGFGLLGLVSITRKKKN